MKLIYEAWSDGEGVTFTTTDEIRNHKEKGLLSKNAKLLHTIEAETFESAMVAHHLKMGWEPYRRN